jgi:DNA-binding CsgD family transcriptional regulator
MGGKTVEVRGLLLTARQAEIIALAAEGLTNDQIARRLQISAHTVSTHMERLFLRNRLHSRAEAVARWSRHSPDES